MKAVCKECLAEVAFDKLFREDSELERIDKCDYCGKTGERIAFVVNDLAGYILEQVGKEYTDPVDELPYDTKEGGYQGKVIDSSPLKVMFSYER